MAKKPRTAKLSVKAPSLPTLDTQAKKEDEEYRIKDDADKVRRYAELFGDKDRHQKALDHIRNEHASMLSIIGFRGAREKGGPKGSVQPRALARSGRKRSTRVPRRGAGR